MNANPVPSCPWCASPLSPGRASCGACGAPVDRPLEVDDAGWVSMPGARDLAELQFGRSRCQIAGAYVPVVDFELHPDDSLYFTHHVLLWKDPQVQISNRGLKGAWKRLFAGLPLIMAQAQGPGHIAFSRDLPGEVIAVPLNVGQEIDVREHVFLVASSDVDYDWFQTRIWYRTRNGEDTETHYPVGMFMDRFVARERPGLLVLHGAGNLFVKRLRAGESVLLKPNALLYKDPSVRMELVINRVMKPSFGGLFQTVASGGRYLWIRVHGPGRVAIQSADKHHHETLAAIVDSSGTIEDM